jgi:NAD(P)H-hydrate epimerase
MRLLIPEIHAPLILDAGALTAMGNNFRPLEKRKSSTILTPHHGEMSRLCRKKVDEVEAARENVAKAVAKKSGAIVVLKGKDSIVTDGEKCIINETGNSGMASAGSGDVLSGVVAALLAQGMEAFDGAALGVYLHGMAGDIAAQRFGRHGLIAGDILDSLPEAFMLYADSSSEE